MKTCFTLIGQKLRHVTSCDAVTLTHHVTLPPGFAELEAVSSGTEVELVKKATCSAVDIQNNKQYLVMGARGSEVTLSRGLKSVSLYRSLTRTSASPLPPPSLPPNPPGLVLQVPSPSGLGGAGGAVAV